MFRGEVAPPLVQIKAICAREILDGRLAEARSRLQPQGGADVSASPMPARAPRNSVVPVEAWDRTRTHTAILRAQSASRVLGSSSPPDGSVMRTLFWNIRGFSQDGRRRQLIEYMREERIDIDAIQETLRTELSLSELKPLSSHLFAWHWLPSSGTTSHSGGILLGVKDATFEIGRMDGGEFYVSMELFERALNVKWEVIVIYGPTDHRRSAAFLEELKRKVAAAQLPLVVDGDFNLIRLEADKSNNLVNFPRMQMFNDCIVDLGLRELDRVGARFTWTNRQADPTRSVLDQVLVSPEWELCCPLASLKAITRIGSDHVPLPLFR